MTLKNPEKLILAAAAVLFAVGVVLAIAQPGNLGDDEAAAPVVTTTTTTTTVPVDATSSTLPGEVTTTTIPGSGINTPGQPSGGSDGTSDTGMESMLGPGLGLLGLGLVLRRALRNATV